MITFEQYAEKLEIPAERIKSSSRKAELVSARQAYIWYMINNGYNLNEASALFGKNHSTGSYAVRKVTDMIECDKRYTERFIKPLIDE